MNILNLYIIILIDKSFIYYFTHEIKIVYHHVIQIHLISKIIKIEYK